MFFRNSKKLKNFFEILKLNLLSGRGYYYYVYIYIYYQFYQSKIYRYAFMISLRYLVNSLSYAILLFSIHAHVRL